MDQKVTVNVRFVPAHHYSYSYTIPEKKFIPKPIQRDGTRVDDVFIRV